MNKGKELSTAGTKVMDGALKGVAVVDGKGELLALGDYVICKKVVDKDSDRLVIIPDEGRTRFVVHSVGYGCRDLGLRRGDTLIVASLTEIPVWHPDMGERDNYTIYNKKQIMGVLRYAEG